MKHIKSFLLRYDNMNKNMESFIANGNMQSFMRIYSTKRQRNDYVNERDWECECEYFRYIYD
jgi:hypothetical protein